MRSARASAWAWTAGSWSMAMMAGAGNPDTTTRLWLTGRGRAGRAAGGKRDGFQPFRDPRDQHRVLIQRQPAGECFGWQPPHGAPAPGRHAVQAGIEVGGDRGRRLRVAGDQRPLVRRPELLAGNVLGFGNRHEMVRWQAGAAADDEDPVWAEPWREADLSDCGQRRAVDSGQRGKVEGPGVQAAARAAGGQDEADW